MNLAYPVLVDAIRAIHARPNGTAALLNLILASETRGAADLTLLSELGVDDGLRLDLARHAADEGRHAYLLVRRLMEMGFSPRRLPPAVDRMEGITALCGDIRGAHAERGRFDDLTVLELLVATSIAERDAVPKLRANVDALTDDPRSRATIVSILRDEQRHVAYLDARIRDFAGRLGARTLRETRERMEAAFEEIDVAYYAALGGYLADCASGAESTGGLRASA